MIHLFRHYSMKFSFISSFSAFLLFTHLAFAGNDDKRGQAGTTELLINPWARSSGWAGAYTAGIRGVESMRFNVAGLSRIHKTELAFSNVRWLVGSDVSINTVGFAHKVSETGALGIDIMMMSLGDFIETKYELPEGTGATFSPQFFNMGISYSKIFSDRISGGATVRIISQSIPNASAIGVALDAGIQYKAGNKDEFKFGVALRNIGPKMKYTGDGLNTRGSRNDQVTGDGDPNLALSIAMLSQNFDMPALLNVGASYDVLLRAENRVTVAGNFLSNTFTKDQFQLGAEYAFNEMFMVRSGFSYQKDIFSSVARTDAHTGWCFGGTVQVPFERAGFNLFKKHQPRYGDGEEAATKAAKPSAKWQRGIGIDYSYRTSNPFGGTHSIGLIFSL